MSCILSLPSSFRTSGVNYVVDQLKAHEINVKIINPNKFAGKMTEPSVFAAYQRVWVLDGLNLCPELRMKRPERREIGAHDKDTIKSLSFILMVKFKLRIVGFNHILS